MTLAQDYLAANKNQQIVVGLLTNLYLTNLYLKNLMRIQMN